ncbi:MAG: hypothetical protein AB1595_04060 [bacterium]
MLLVVAWLVDSLAPIAPCGWEVIKKLRGRPLIPPHWYSLA